jgi:ELWxxDGT repeat protein
MNSIAGLARFGCFALLLVPVLAPSLGSAAAAVHLVRDINTVPVPASSYPEAMGTLGPNVLFNARNAGGPGLWTTNGTASGTHVLKDINPSGGACPSWFCGRPRARPRAQRGSLTFRRLIPIPRR